MTEPKMKIIGVYQIQSKVKPNRIYIGSSINIVKRWNLHLELLRKNIHGNQKLQRHYNKYGESDLQFSIILNCIKEDILKIEQQYLDSSKPYFNIYKIAGSPLGHHWKWTEESKKRFSKKKKGCMQSECARELNRKAHLGQIPWNKNKKNCFSKNYCYNQSQIMKEVWRLRKLIKKEII